MEFAPKTILKVNLTRDEEMMYRNIIQELNELRNELSKYPNLANVTDHIVKTNNILLSMVENGEIKSH